MAEQWSAIQREESVRTVAVLMVGGFKLVGSDGPGNRARVGFLLSVPEDKQDEYEDLLRVCNEGYNINVCLQEYFRCYGKLKAIIRQRLTR